MTTETTHLLDDTHIIAVNDWFEWQPGAWTRICKDSLLVGKTPAAAVAYLHEKTKFQPNGTPFRRDHAL